MASTGGSAGGGGGADAGAASSRQGRGDGHRGDKAPGGRGGRGGRGRGRGGGGSGGGDGGRRGNGQGEGPAAPRNEGGGGRRRGGRRGGGAAGGDTAESGDAAAATPAASKDARLRLGETKARAEDAEGDDDDAEVCFICANPVVHHSIAPCNHITCHICALRMRALYRTKDCPHCRTAAPHVIFTDDPAKRFDEYGAGDIASTDDNIGIQYTKAEIVDDTVLLLRYNCPDDHCDYAALGWPDLHRHVRDVHHKKMCDLCTRNKKVFTHEHELFTDKGLERHMRHGDDRPGAVDQTGFRGHPLCGFCGERFYDDDKLYEHCRNKHERCFICDRRDARQPHYYRNYNALEDHFRKDHYLCFDRECLEKKFVVFESELDLKAHQLSEHGNSLSKDVRRDVQVVSMSDFDFRPAYQERHVGGGGNGGRGGGSGSGSGNNSGGRPSRGRDPNADVAPTTTAPPLRRDELAYQRQMAIHSAQSVTTRTFGARLTAPTPAPQAEAPAQTQTPSRTGASPAPAAAAAAAADPMAPLDPAAVARLAPQERARRVRHGAVLERAANLLANDAAKMAAFRAQIAAFRNGPATGAGALVDGFLGLFAHTSATALGSLLREVADLFDDPAHADALRRAWQDRRAVHEDYPSLPSVDASAASSGWAGAASTPTSAAASAAGPAGRQSTRVLRLKNSTRQGGGSLVAAAAPASSGPGGRTVPGATWTVPATRSSVLARSGPAASASPSAAFPALPGAAKKSGGGSGTGSASWVGSTVTPSTSSLAARLGGPGSASASGTSTPSRRPASEDAFPALPAAPKPLTTIFGYGRGAVRRDVGNRETGFSWGAEAGNNDGAGTPAEAAEEHSTGKGKKKGKKVLVQWG